MGDRNQALFVGGHVARDYPRRVIEIGSRQYAGSTVPWRVYFSGAQYVGIDAQAGDGVDLVADITRPVDVEPADLVICCSVLEHVERPWLAAAVLESMVRPGGMMYLAVPWVWRYHAYPDDYWRFSPSAVRSLFSAIRWDVLQYSTTTAGEFFDAVPGADGSRARMDGDSKHLPYLQVHALGVRV